MKLLKNEEILISSNENKVVLTDHRISMFDEVWGKSYKISMFLEDISSFETHYKSNIFFLIIGVLLSIVGLLTFAKGGLGGIVFGGIFIALWLFSRKHLVTISSKGGKPLNFIVEQMTDDQIEEFVSQVQEAKLKRVNLLFNQYSNTKLTTEKEFISLL